jgi:hypothetical protein
MNEYWWRKGTFIRIVSCQLLNTEITKWKEATFVIGPSASAITSRRLMEFNVAGRLFFQLYWLTTIEKHLKGLLVSFTWYFSKDVWCFIVVPKLLRYQNKPMLTTNFVRLANNFFLLMSISISLWRVNFSL